MATAVVNVEMAAAWDGDEGDDWARDWRRYDRAVQAHHRVLLDACGIGRTDRVLDVGCGTGETARDAAWAAADGEVLGVDLSSRMIDRARQLARSDGLGHVHFERADAQVHPFEPASYDLALSRFGTMFFADQAAAFANIATAIRPGGRLVMIGWRRAADNEWLRCVLDAVALGRELPVHPPGAPGPFGLADPGLTGAALEAAGFEAVDFTPVDLPFWVGVDGEDAFGYFRETGIVRGMTQDLDDWQHGRALDALHATMVEHDTGDGVQFGSGAWLVTARKAAR